jgi:hypothetical protein
MEARVMTTRTILGMLAAAATALAAASCTDSGTGPSDSETPPAPVATAAPTPTTTALFNGSWTGTTDAGKSLSFRVLSGQLTDFTIEFDLGSGCVHRAKTPSSFDPVDAIYPIGNDGKVGFNFRDPAIDTNVRLEFTGAKTAKGWVDPSRLVGRGVDCGNRVVGPGTSVPGLTFTASRP